MELTQVTEDEQTTNFVLNTNKVVFGNRRLVRTKILQILTAHFVSNTPIELLINHIFNRYFIVDEEYNDSDSNNIKLSANEVIVDEEKLADINYDSLISWKPNDQEFAMTIIHSTIKNYDLFVEYIKKTSDNWAFDRIAILDRVIMMIAMSEFLCAPDVPIKVTINEALELAKTFSTPKSTMYVNGMLEKIKDILEAKKLIYKSERGLQSGKYS